MDLLALEREKTAREFKLTVLHQPNGTWSRTEIERLTNGLMTEISVHPHHPEYLILSGHYEKAVVLKALLGGVAFTATTLVDINNTALPFKPTFM